MGQDNNVYYDPYTGRYMQRPNRPSFQSFASNQQPQQPMLNCKFITDPTKIMPSEVPTNGDPAAFIMQDYSSVYLKAINSNGTIDTVQYMPVKQEKPEDIQKKQFEGFQQSVFAKLAQLESMIAEIGAQQSQRFSQPVAPKDQKRQEGGNRNG